jgi:hypothetical protein
MTRLRLFLIASIVLGSVVFAPQGALALTTAQRLKALETAVATLKAADKTQNTKITSLTSQLNTAKANITVLNAKVHTLETANVSKLNPYVSVVATSINGLVGPHVIFSGCNVHVQSGSGVTDYVPPNGLGNLVIGYDEMLGSSDASRTGSHNLVIGRANDFSGFGGFVGGYGNWINGNFSSVFDGSFNGASGGNAAVLTGEHNWATAADSSVSGGRENTATANFSSISGYHNILGADDTGWYGGGTFHMP